MKQISIKSSFLFFACLLLTPATSMADMHYGFVKVTCNPESKTAEIKIFSDWNEAGRARVKNPEKDTYYFDAWAKKHKKTKCDLGEHQIISISGQKYEKHPADDNVSIKLNGQNLEGWYPIYPASEITIELLKAGEYQVNVCKASLAEDNKIDTEKCEAKHIVNGKKVQ